MCTSLHALHSYSQVRTQTRYGGVAKKSTKNRTSLLETRKCDPQKPNFNAIFVIVVVVVDSMVCKFTSNVPSALRTYFVFSFLAGCGRTYYFKFQVGNFFPASYTLLQSIDYFINFLRCSGVFYSVQFVRPACGQLSHYNTLLFGLSSLPGIHIMSYRVPFYKLVFAKRRHILRRRRRRRLCTSDRWCIYASLPFLYYAQEFVSRVRQTSKSYFLNFGKKNPTLLYA